MDEQTKLLLAIEREKVESEYEAQRLEKSPDINKDEEALRDLYYNYGKIDACDNIKEEYKKDQ